MLLNLGILSLARLFLICLFVAIRTPLEISNNGNYLVQNGRGTQTFEHSCSGRRYLRVTDSYRVLISNSVIASSYLL